MFHKAGFGRIAGITGLGLLTLVLIASGIACKKSGQPSAAPAEGAPAAAAAETGVTIKEGLNEITGTVKTALGNYFYLLQVPGFDIAVTGQVQGGDVTTLVDKAVVVKALFNRQDPNLLVAQSIEVKDGTTLTNVYASTDASSPSDHFTQTKRAEFVELKITNINKSEDWEDKGKGKVFGKLIPGPNNQGQYISILDAANKEIGKVIVDSMTNYAQYYVKKLRLFDSYYFYLNIKDTVARNLRTKNKEIFHADVVAVGLY
jgi:hypothetical protein